MKPRTKFEKKIVELNQQLPPISSKVVDWAVNKLISHPLFRTSSGACSCGDCGHTFNYKGKRKCINCPECGKKVSVFDTRKRTSLHSTYFAKLEIIDAVQVERVYLLQVEFRKKQELKVSNTEICRLWINSNGQTALTARKRSYGYYLDNFNLDSDIELRSMSDTFWVISDCAVFPQYKVLPELKRNGFSRELMKLHPVLTMKALLSDPRIETLCKGGNIEAMKYFISHPYSLNKCWNSYKIASRHGYKIEDYSLWCDLINLLEKCGKDINNTHFISPLDLRKEHDFWLPKARKAERKKREEEKLMRDKENEENFFKTKSKFFGIVIKDDDIEISVLDSIDAFKEEGEAMHHCVFNCQYFSKENSLILSARDTKGNRIETVEFSLIENKVIQSRGICNTDTEYHDRIINLVNNNAYRFTKAKVTA